MRHSLRTTLPSFSNQMLERTCTGLPPFFSHESLHQASARSKSFVRYRRSYLSPCGRKGFYLLPLSGWRYLLGGHRRQHPCVEEKSRKQTMPGDALISYQVSSRRR